MRAVAAIIFVVAILVVLAVAWYMIEYRGKAQRRRQARLADLQSKIRKVSDLVNDYSPADAMGGELERQAREILSNYHVVLSVSSTEKRWLQGAEVAYARLSVLIDRHPQTLFAPTDDASRKFVREAFAALHPTEKKETPHVP